MININDYNSAVKWLESIQLDSDDYDFRQQIDSVIEQMESDHEEAEAAQDMRDALQEVNRLTEDY